MRPVLLNVVIGLLAIDSYRQHPDGSPEFLNPLTFKQLGTESGGAISKPATAASAPTGIGRALQATAA
jgi:hypothetical protein